MKYSTALYSVLQYGTIQYNTALYSVLQYGTIQYSTALYSVLQYGTIQYNRALYSVLQYGTIQYNRAHTMQYSVSQCSTVLDSTMRCSNSYSTLQYCTVRYNASCIVHFHEATLLMLLPMHYHAIVFTAFYR
jgi:hypothetical protein